MLTVDWFQKFRQILPAEVIEIEWISADLSYNFLIGSELLATRS